MKPETAVGSDGLDKRVWSSKGHLGCTGASCLSRCYASDARVDCAKKWERTGRGNAEPHNMSLPKNKKLKRADGEDMVGDEVEVVIVQDMTVLHAEVRVGTSGGRMRWG